MASAFKVSDYKNGKRIILSSPLDTRGKVLEFSYSIMFLLPMIACLWALLTIPEIVLDLFLLVAIVICAIVVYRTGLRSIEYEWIYIEKEKFEIVNSLPGKKKIESFLIKDISNFRFHDKPRLEPHPLKGESFDYLGFQTEQEVIADIHAEGRITFDYCGKEYRFGKDLYSWDFEQIEIILYDLTGNDFRYSDEYEKKHFPPGNHESH